MLPKSFKVRGAPHLTLVLHPESRKAVVRELVKAARSLDREAPFDALALMGNSGLLVGPQVADKLGKPFIVVHKPSAPATRHYSGLVEGIITSPVRYAFLDDLISTGKTLEHTKQTIEQVNPGSELVGILLYQSVGLAGIKSAQEYVVSAGHPGRWLPCRRIWSRYSERDAIRDKIEDDGPGF